MHTHWGAPLNSVADKQPRAEDILVMARGGVMRQILLTWCTLFSTGLLSWAQTSPEAQLRAHSAQFRREVVKVTEGVHVAIGFGLANSILIEGDTGVIIVDTMESDAAAREVKAAFDQITPKPVLALVYTHNHRDHTLGSDILAGPHRPAIYAHAAFAAEEAGASPVRRASAIRTRRQFGLDLPDHLKPNLGIGPRLNMAEKDDFLPPTVTFEDTLETTVAGIRLKLVHAPGESNDQLYVFLPDKSVLLPADNYYHSFPNLYAIRGTGYRDVRAWIASLEAMIAENVAHLVPSHSRPVTGRTEVRQRLTDYRNAIAWVFERTNEGINQGMTPDQIVETVRLPDALASAPYLQEFYGTVPWSVRSVFAGQLGWFSGNATDLFPLSGRERARRIIELAGGQDKLLTRVRESLRHGEHQWAAELVDSVLALQPQHVEGRELKAEALEALARQQTSANARNYYLSSAQELHGSPPVR